ncbi:MAG: helix-turn-helix domain-containing protein [Bacteroidetes bacterium]|nr:helix-turn-helix domain-containing protein [Bacteroidota bacterium]
MFKNLIKNMIDKIRNKKQYDQVQQMIENFIKKATDGGGFHSLNKRDDAELNQLSLLASDYEKNVLHLWPLPVSINAIVQQKIAEMNITQGKLAELFEMADSKLSKILTGKREPDIQFLKAIHEKLGIDGNLILERV